MKKQFLAILFSLASTLAIGQLKISQMPLYTGPLGGDVMVPITAAGQTFRIAATTLSSASTTSTLRMDTISRRVDTLVRKIDSLKIGKVDSLRFSNDTIYFYKYGTRFFLCVTVNKNSVIQNDGLNVQSASFKINGLGSFGVARVNSSAFVGSESLRVGGETRLSDLTVEAKATFSGITIEPAGSNGMFYYNSSLGKFRAYENGAWKDVISAGAASAAILTATPTSTTAQSGGLRIGGSIFGTIGIGPMSGFLRLEAASSTKLQAFSAANGWADLDIGNLTMNNGTITMKETVLAEVKSTQVANATVNNIVTITDNSAGNIEATVSMISIDNTKSFHKKINVYYRKTAGVLTIVGTDVISNYTDGAWTPGFTASVVSNNVSLNLISDPSQNTGVKLFYRHTKETYN